MILRQKPHVHLYPDTDVLTIQLIAMLADYESNPRRGLEAESIGADGEFTQFAIYQYTAREISTIFDSDK